MGLRRHHDAPHLRFPDAREMISIGDDYWIEDESGSEPSRSTARRCAFATPGCSRTPSGHEVATIQEKKLSVRDKIKIELGGGRRRP